jgi:hypothetical protein
MMIYDNTLSFHTPFSGERGEKAERMTGGLSDMTFSA